MGPPYCVEGSKEPSFWAATVFWPLSPDVKDRSATSTSIGKTYGRSVSQSVSPSCLKFGLMILRSSWNQGMATHQQCSRLRSEHRGLISRRFFLCPIRAFKIYFERSAPFRQLEQLFVCFGGRTKGSPVTKQRLSRWIIDAIKLAYSSLGQLCPMGVRTLGMV